MPTFCSLLLLVPSLSSLPPTLSFSSPSSLPLRFLSIISHFYFFFFFVPLMFFVILKSRLLFVLFASCNISFFFFSSYFLISRNSKGTEKKKNPLFVFCLSCFVPLVAFLEAASYTVYFKELCWKILNGPYSRKSR